MQTLLKSDEESRPYLNLARHRAELIKKGIGPKSDRVAFIETQLKSADDEFLKGEKIPAREKWQSIVKLYNDDPQFEVIVKRAKARLLDPEEALKAEQTP